jgi:serine phosphatase RsbU (regulator of sigma subunit)
VGKGLSAAMWFTHMVGLIRIFAGCSEAPAEVASRINSHLATVVQPEPPLTTLFLACCDTRTGELTYCNAGHPAPLLLRQDGSADWLASGGPVLGAVREAAFANGMTVLDRGDTLVSYSDGILECRNTLGEEFGVERLAQAAAAAGASANTLLFSVLGAVQDFAAGEPPADDLSLMVVHRLDES